MTHFSRRALIMLPLAAIVLAVSGLPTHAQEDIDAAKRNRLVGERADGYLGIVTATPSPELRRLVDRINSERRARYAEIARQNGTPVEAVERIAGQKLIERASPGTYVMPAGGGWRLR